MALPQDSANGELCNDTTEAVDERVSLSSSSSSYSSEEAGGTKRQYDVGAATPPPTQQMDRYSSSSSSSDDDEAAVDRGRIPAEVFERDDPAAEANNKDWSMMSTDSVFALQVAPSSDFTGFFLAHPELMDISTPPRASTVHAADADAEPAALVPPFESIPELPETTTMKGNYSFAFPNLIEDKRPNSKKVQDEQPAATTDAAQDEPAPAKAEPQTSSKPLAAPENGPAKGGLFACFPCCS